MMTRPRDNPDPEVRPADRAAGIRPAGLRTAKTKLTEVVAVCSKCAKRQGLDSGAVRKLLKGAAKQAAKDGRLPGRSKICVVESGCLGPCPKRAVAVATGASLAAGRVVLLDPDAGPQAALAAVLGPVLPRRPVPEFGPNTALAAVAPDESPPDT